MPGVYYPIPFFNVDKEGNLHLSKDWPVYKEYLNNDMPINNLINSVDNMVEKIGIDRAKDLIPKNVLSLLAVKDLPFQLSHTVANESITLSRDQVQCLLAHRILSFITPKVIDGIIQFNTSLLKENPDEAEADAIDDWFNSLLLYFSCISKANYENQQEFLTYSRKHSEVISKWEECDKPLNELKITTGNDILERPKYNHIIDDDPIIGLGSGGWEEESVLSSISPEMMLFSGLTKDYGLNGFDYLLSSGSETAKVIFEALNSNDDIFDAYKNNGDIVEGIVQTNYIFYRKQVKKIKLEKYNRIIYNEMEVEKELNEIYNSYLLTSNNNYPIISIKNNNPMNEELSLILKWMSSSINNKKLFYVTNKPASLNIHFNKIYSKLYNKMKVKDLHRIVKQYNEIKVVNKNINSLFKFITKFL